MAGAAPASLLPQAVVDAVGFGCHPLVPTAYHERLQRWGAAETTVGASRCWGRGWDHTRLAVGGLD